MIRHKWKDNTCTVCGVIRKRKAWKKLMAIFNHPPWEGYMKGVDWAYSIDGIVWTFKRPDCLLSSEQNPERSVATDDAQRTEP